MLEFGVGAAALIFLVGSFVLILYGLILLLRRYGALVWKVAIVALFALAFTGASLELGRSILEMLG